MRICWSLVVSLTLAVPATAEDVVIRAAKVYTMAGPPLVPGAVLVSDGKITRVASKIEPPAGAKLIDLGEGVLLPGLVDAYGSSAIAGNPEEMTREITPSYRVLAAVDWQSRALREALSEGTTTLGLSPGTDGVIAGLACAVKTDGNRRVVKEDTALFITMASDPASGNSSRQRPDSIYARQPTNRMGVVWMLRSTFDQASKQKTPDLAVIREALAGQRRMFSVSRTDFDILSLLRLAKEFHFTPTIVGGHEAYKVKEELLAAKVPVILGTITSSSSVVGPEQGEAIWNQPALLHKAGISFALSGGRLLEQARFAIRFGLAEDSALEAITRTPARLLGIEQRVGSLEVGKDADLLALNGDPFELTTSILWTMVDGKIKEKGN